MKLSLVFGIEIHNTENNVEKKSAETKDLMTGVV